MRARMDAGVCDEETLKVARKFGGGGSCGFVCGWLSCGCGGEERSLCTTSASPKLFVILT